MPRNPTPARYVFAVRAFTASPAEGERTIAVAHAQRWPADHPIVRRFPDAFRTFTPPSLED